jgi:hypothetical protein
MCKSILLVAPLLFSFIAPLSAEVVLFQDNFENGLGKWTGSSGGSTSGVIVQDPLGTSRGKALTFTSFSYTGDIFTASKISTAGYGAIHVSFDYLGMYGGSGGFVGVATGNPFIAGGWIAGVDQSAANGAGFTGIGISNDGSWHNYDIDITSMIKWNSLNDFNLIAEDWGDSGRSHGAYFDNIKVTASVPEPSSLSLLVLGGVVVALRKRKRA